MNNSLYCVCAPGHDDAILPTFSTGRRCKASSNCPIGRFIKQSMGYPKSGPIRAVASQLGRPAGRSTCTWCWLRTFCNVRRANRSSHIISGQTAQFIQTNQSPDRPSIYSGMSSRKTYKQTKRYPSHRSPKRLPNSYRPRY